MSLLERIRADHTTACRRGDSIVADGLAVVLTVVAAEEKRLTRTLTDREVQAFVRGVRRQSDRPGADAARLLSQLLIYLPALTDQEIEDITVRQNRFMNPTEIISYLRRHYHGRYDATRAAQIVREITS